MSFEKQQWYNWTYSAHFLLFGVLDLLCVILNIVFNEFCDKGLFINYLTQIGDWVVGQGITPGLG